ncbi:MAG: type III secretion system inner membrane ring subunit SctD [Pseudomonas sp.]|jgi:type III secretion protein D|uniref:type III secretion system inner membrane ring subunit SctD n=1 Tax=Pseudomonas sp. TaxID=306 RepID=UPI002399E044|nr:type III secretion system inner membrane ring subunit SctD [Pseudomonas sp.]MDE1195956.1 type III secretion system inner membrane ring subunit SctD [Pseudomonas sp.]
MFELRVLTGLHQGAALPLVGEQWSIGSDAEQDLALHDPGVEQLHCRLRRQGDGWALNAADGSICDEEGHRHATAELTPNRAFVLGSVWLCVSPAEDAWPSVPALIPPPAPEPQPEPAVSAPPLEKIESRSRILNRTTGIVIGVLLGIAGSAWSLTRSAGVAPESVPVSAVAQRPIPPASKPGSAAEPTHKRIQLADLEDTRRQLNTMLSDRLLSEVNVQQTPEGLALSGNLKAESRVVYQRMLQRFKDRYQSPVALIDNVSTSSNGLPFTIVQIMSGPHAHLVTADGHRLYIGDELEGLRLTRIDDKSIQFDGDRHYEVNW